MDLRIADVRRKQFDEVELLSVELLELAAREPSGPVDVEAVLGEAAIVVRDVADHLDVVAFWARLRMKLP